MNGIHGMPDVTALSKLKDRQFLRMVEIKTENTPKLSDALRKLKSNLYLSKETKGTARAHFWVAR